MNKVFDATYARKLAKGHNLKVALRKSKMKGTSLYAAKNIKKGNIIAYYKFKVFKMATHRQVKGGMYGMTVYTKKVRESPTLIGDIYPGSMTSPKRGISFWAYFSNEPATKPKQDENAYLDINVKQNYKDRARVKVGDTMVYKLRASKNIKKGEEVVWCYGGSYGRGYPANCDE